MPTRIADRASYYRTYYQNNKDYIKNRYLEKKEKDKLNEDLYKPYGGETKYYRQALINCGFLVIKKIDTYPN